MIRKFGSSGIDMQPSGLDLGLGTPNTIIRGTITMNSGVSSLNITISAVDLSRSIVLIQPYPNNSGFGAADILCSYKLTSTTNIQVQRASSGVSLVLAYSVITFNKLKSIQRGDATSIPDGGTNVTVSAVTIAKCFVWVSNNGNISINGYLTTTTNLLIPSQGTSALACWQIAEFE